MATEVKVPALGESITEATLAQWLKKPGEAVAADEPIATLEPTRSASTSRRRSRECLPRRWSRKATPSRSAR